MFLIDAIYSAIAIGNTSSFFHQWPLTHSPSPPPPLFLYFSPSPLLFSSLLLSSPYPLSSPSIPFASSTLPPPSSLPSLLSPLPPLSPPSSPPPSSLSSLLSPSLLSLPLLALPLLSLSLLSLPPPPSSPSSSSPSPFSPSPFSPSPFSPSPSLLPLPPLRPSPSYSTVINNNNLPAHQRAGQAMGRGVPSHHLPSGWPLPIESSRPHPLPPPCVHRSASSSSDWTSGRAMSGSGDQRCVLYIASHTHHYHTLIDRPSSCCPHPSPLAPLSPLRSSFSCPILALRTTS